MCRSRQLLDKEAFGRYLKERYQSQLDWCDEKAIRNQRLCAQLGLIGTSALTPVLLVSHFLEPVWWLAALALVSAVAILLITGTWEHGNISGEEHWLSYRSTCESLRFEFYIYQVGTKLYRDTPDKDARFVERAEKILSCERGAWREGRKSGSATVSNCSTTGRVAR